MASSTPEHSTAKESRTIKKPRILVDSDEVSSVDSHIRRPGEVLRSTAAPDMGLLRKFMDKKLVPTDEVRLLHFSLLLLPMLVTGSQQSQSFDLKIEFGWRPRCL